jgi:hypothetical protein
MESANVAMRAERRPRLTGAGVRSRQEEEADGEPDNEEPGKNPQQEAGSLTGSHGSSLRSRKNRVRRVGRP